MLYLVTPRLQRGKTLTQKQVQSAEPVWGDVVITQNLAPALKRYSNVAQFQLANFNAPQPLPPLYDVTLSWMGPNGFVLAGFELIDGVAYAQSWWLRNQP